MGTLLMHPFWGAFLLERMQCMRLYVIIRSLLNIYIEIREVRR